MTKADQISYLLSFLTILIHRAGGTLVIENLSNYAKSNLELGMKLDVENDRVVLTATKKEYQVSKMN